MNRLVAVFILAFVTLCCNKGNNSNNGWSFKWTHQNVSHSASGADAYISPAGLGFGPNQILAFISSTTNNFRVSVRLTSLATGSYSVTLSSNKFDYVDDSGNNLFGVQGTVTITLSSGGKLSGSFSVKLMDSSSNPTTIDGSFENVNIHP